MAVTVSGTTIDFDNKTISATPDGIAVDGFIEATNFIGLSTHSQATAFGYGGGGDNPDFSPSTNTTFYKYPIVMDGDAILSSIAAMPDGNRGGYGVSSDTNGYDLGGTGIPQVAGFTWKKMPFANDTWTVGTQTPFSVMDSRTDYSANFSSTHAYKLGGNYDSPLAVPGIPAPQDPIACTDQILKFPFASEGIFSDLTDAFENFLDAASLSNSTTGYQVGGRLQLPNPQRASDTIRKFPFASETSSSAASTGFNAASNVRTAFENFDIQGIVSQHPKSPTLGASGLAIFPFASETNVFDFGQGVAPQTWSNVPHGHSSTEGGFTFGAFSPQTTSVVHKLSFQTYLYSSQGPGFAPPNASKATRIGREGIDFGV